MKKILASAIVALTPAAAMAADGNVTDGYASVSVGYNTMNQGDWSNSWGYFSGGSTTNSGTDTGKADGLDVEARASIAVPLGGRFAAQLDGVFSRTAFKMNNCGDCDTAHLNTSSFAVHAFARNPRRGLVGVIVQRSQLDWNWGSGESIYYFGGEGQLFLGRASIGGQVTYATVDSPSWYDESGINAAVQLRLFPKDNLGFTLRGGYEHMKMTPGATSGYDCPGYCWYLKQDAWEVGGKAEYRLPGSRLSLLADVDYRNLKKHRRYQDVPNDYWNENRAKFSDFRAMVGIKFNFGATSLYERDRSGASLDPVRPMTGDMWMFEL